MLNRIAEELRQGRKVVLVHGNADMDALGSAYALSKAFPEADVYAPNGLDRVTRMVSEKMDVAILEQCDLSCYDRVVVVDTSSPEQLEGVSDIPGNAIVIDHHKPTGKWDFADTFYCDDTRTSCCEIIKELIDAAGIPITRDMGLMLLGGMLTDSGHFQFARPAMLPAFADIMSRCGIEMDEAMELTQAPVSMSERIAMMKAIERTRFDRVGEMIVAISFGGSFEASSCRAIMAASQRQGDPGGRQEGHPSRGDHVRDRRGDDVRRWRPRGSGRAHGHRRHRGHAEHLHEQDDGRVPRHQEARDDGARELTVLSPIFSMIYNKDRRVPPSGNDFI